MTKKAKKDKNRKNVEGLIHLRIAEATGMFTSLARSLCNGHSPKANARAEKRAEQLVKTAQHILSLMRERSELAVQGKESHPWEKMATQKQPQ
ncbi:MAG: hypothetical protein AAB585_02080 [Patescibacteria group bacterium]